MLKSREAGDLGDDAGNADEDHWQRKEARRLARDLAQLNPVTLGALLL